MRVIVHASCLAPLLWLYYAIPRGLLGGDPVEELIHFLGLGALRLLILTLCVSPLAKMLKFGALMKLRRALGLWCFAWASMHIFAWLAFDLTFAWSLIGEELIKRTYILLGAITWLMLLALTVTSLPKLMRRMGKAWKKLHSLIYMAVLLGCIHFWWSLKSGWIEPVIYLLVSFSLLWFRRKYIGKLVNSISIALIDLGQRVTRKNPSP